MGGSRKGNLYLRATQKMPKQLGEIVRFVYMMPNLLPDHHLSITFLIDSVLHACPAKWLFDISAIDQVVLTS